MAESTDKPARLRPFYRYDPFTSVFYLFIIFFASQILAIMVVSLYPAVQNWTGTQSQAWLTNSISSKFAYVLLAEVAAVSAVLWLAKLAGIARSRLGLIKPKISDAGWAFVGYGLYFLCFLAVSIIAKWLVPGLDFEQEQQNGFENAQTTFELLATFAALAVLVPLGEEVMFRGFLFSSLRAKYQFKTAAIVTSIIFGIAHLQFGTSAPLLWVAALDTFILSMFLCKLREEEQSVWPAVFLHAIKNSLAFVVLFGSRFIY